MKRVNSVVLLIVLMAFVPTSANAGIIGWVASYLLGKGVDHVWDKVTGKPDVRLLDKRLAAVEGELRSRDRRFASEVRKLRRSVSEDTTREEYMSLAEGVVDRIAALELRVARNEEGIARNTGNIDRLSSRVSELEEARVGADVVEYHAPKLRTSTRTSWSMPSERTKALISATRREEIDEMVVTRESAEEQQARVVFGTALHDFWAGEYDAASRAFAQASVLDAKNPRYLYFAAVAQFELGKMDWAIKFVDAGTALEKEYPITSWGWPIERVQGRARIWLEGKRRAALRPSRDYSSSASSIVSLHSTTRP